MDQVTEDRQWAGVSVLERERDGVANAEAHAEVGRSKNTHTVLVATGAVELGVSPNRIPGVIFLTEP